MKSALIMSKHLNKPLHDYCEYTEHRTIVLDKGKLEDFSKIEEIQQLIDDGYDLNIAGSVKQSGRYDYFNKVHFLFSKKLLRDKIEDSQVEDAMKVLLKKEIGIPSWDNIECKVMTLFKEGKIKWEDVVKAHKEDCKF